MSIMISFKSGLTKYTSFQDSLAFLQLWRSKTGDRVWPAILWPLLCVLTDKAIKKKTDKSMKQSQTREAIYTGTALLKDSVCFPAIWKPPPCLARLAHWKATKYTCIYTVHTYVSILDSTINLQYINQVFWRRSSAKLIEVACGFLIVSCSKDQPVHKLPCCGNLAGNLGLPEIDCNRICWKVLKTRIAYDCM